MEEKQANINTGNNTGKEIVEIDNKPVLPQKISKNTVEATLATPAYTHRITNFFGGNQKDALRFQASTLACINKNPKLAQCTPASFFDTLNKCAEFRLFPDGRTAALVPVSNSKLGKMECQFRLMAQGYIELFARNGILVSAVDVCEHDEYDETNGVITHRIDRFAEYTGKRGTRYGFVVHAQFPDKRIKSEFISLKYIDKVRGISKNQTLWNTEWLEMAKKTCIRYLAKTLPQTSEIQWAIKADDEAGFDFNNKTPYRNSFTGFQPSESSTGEDTEDTKEEDWGNAHKEKE